jgi:hypothetical protein
MEILLPFLLLAFGFHFVKTREQQRRIALLGGYLGRYQIEKLMENLTEGYLRALGEDDAGRRAQIWSTLATGEAELSAQFQRFAEDFAQVWGDHALVSTLPLALPYADKLFPRATFDLRQALAIHAQGIAAAVDNRAGRSLRDKAYTLSAELFLMQHSCHWFCRSRAVASARLLARHQTSYAQVLAAVAPQTRQAYCGLVGC